MFFAFDLLHQDGVDLRHLPLSERKRDLDRLCGRSKVRVLRMSNTFPTVPCCLSTAPIMALKASCRNASIARMSTGHARCGRRRSARAGSGTMLSALSFSRRLRANAATGGCTVIPIAFSPTSLLVHIRTKARVMSLLPAISLIAFDVLTSGTCLATQ